MKFSKFFVASLKRTAQNVYPLVRRRNKLVDEIMSRQQELDEIQVELDGYQAPIARATGGFTTDDLVVRTVVDTGKKDKDGNPIKITKYELRYPETIVPTSREEVKEEPQTVENTEETPQETPVEDPFADLPFGITAKEL